MKKRKLKSIPLQSPKTLIFEKTKKRITLLPKRKPELNLVPYTNPGSRLGRRKIRDLYLRWPEDLFHNSILLTTLQNKLMRDGKKGQAEKLFLQTLKELNRYSQGQSATLIHTALERLKPSLITVLRRVGRNYYNVPVPVNGVKQYKIALRWLVEGARKNIGVPLSSSLADEVISTVASSHSEALKKKDVLYESVIRNRAYYHYRWI